MGQSNLIIFQKNLNKTQILLPLQNDYAYVRSATREGNCASRPLILAQILCPPNVAFLK